MRLRVFEYDPDRPWVVVSDRTVETDASDDEARERWPSPRFRVERAPEVGPWPPADPPGS